VLDFVATQVQFRRENPRRVTVETPAQSVGEVGDEVGRQIDVHRPVLGANERPRFELGHSVVRHFDPRQRREIRRLVENARFHERDAVVGQIQTSQQTQIGEYAFLITVSRTVLLTYRQHCPKRGGVAQW